MFSEFYASVSGSLQRFQTILFPAFMGTVRLVDDHSLSSKPLEVVSEEDDLKVGWVGPSSLQKLRCLILVDG